MQQSRANAQALMTGRNMQGIDEVLTPVEHAGHFISNAGDLEELQAFMHVHAGVRRRLETRNGFGAELGLPGGFVGFAEDAQDGIGIRGFSAANQDRCRHGSRA